MYDPLSSVFWLRRGSTMIFFNHQLSTSDLTLQVMRLLRASHHKKSVEINKPLKFDTKELCSSLWF